MEAPLKMRANEDEEVIEMDLKTRVRRSHHTHTTSPTSSESSGSSESSNISFEDDVVGHQNNHTNGTSNGENSTIVEEESVTEEAQVEAEKKEDLVLEEETHKEEEGEDVISIDSSSVSFNTHNQGTNGISFHQNGHTIEFSLSESHAGSLEITSNSNSSSVSKSPDTAVGLKDLERLLDESSNNLNVAATDAYSALLDTLNNASESVEAENGNLKVPKDVVSQVQEINAVIKTYRTQEHVLKLNNASVGNENGHLHLLRDPISEVEEFDVERVVQKQETHDFYCPNCNSCITKRVILKRRKRKIQEISSPSQENDRQPPAQPGSTVSDEIVQGTQDDVAADVSDTGDERISAITCSSCLSIFFSTENGWLWRIFRRTPEVTEQRDASLTEPLLPSGSATEVGQEPVNQAISPGPPGTGSAFPLWIVSCCQPSTERPVRPETPAAPEPAPGPGDSQPVTKLPPTTPGTSSPPEHEPSGEPDHAGTGTGKPIEPAPSTPQPSVVPGGPAADEMFARWFLNCCQPNTTGISKPQVLETSPVPKPGPVPDVGASSSTSDPTTSKKPDDEIQHGSEQLTTPSEDEPSVGTDTKPTPERKFALWFLNCCQPQDGPQLQVPREPGVDESSAPSKPPISSDNPNEDNLPSFDPISDVKPGGSTGTPLPDPPTHVTTPDDSATDMPTNTTVPDVSVPPNIAPPQKPEGGAPPISPPHTSIDETKPDDSVPPNITTPPDDDEILQPVLKPPRRPDEITVVPEPKPKPTPTPPVEEVIIPMPSDPAPAKPTNLGVIRPGEGDISDDPKAPLIGTSDVHDATSEERPTPEPRPGVEIIRAIVYGGLLECITSLSVITSAAGGDATTLNIVALGLANVFGGLILLFHNLRVLKHEHGTERYIQQLGRPGHYWLHAIVAVISYLIFGLMAPIIYGFTYRKSDNKDNKLIVLASASLVCIAILSAAKAHVRTPTKAYMATVFYYLGVGFSVSGVGYVAGHFINMLLKKLGVFDLAAAAAPGAAADVNGGVWASY